ncbi:hypothetical protein Ancab_038028 [Ancistrocladus abbreviatus]
MGNGESIDLPSVQVVFSASGKSNQGGQGGNNLSEKSDCAVLQGQPNSSASSLTYHEDHNLHLSMVPDILDGASVKMDNATRPTTTVDHDVDGSCKSVRDYELELDIRDLYNEEYKLERNDSSSGECINLNEMRKTFEELASIEHGGMSSGYMSMTRSSSWMNMGDKDQDAELTVELDAIEAKFQHWFHELSRMREEVLEATKKRWMVKKKTAAPSI